MQCIVISLCVKCPSSFLEEFVGSITCFRNGFGSQEQVQSCSNPSVAENRAGFDLIKRLYGWTEPINKKRPRIMPLLPFPRIDLGDRLGQVFRHFIPIHMVNSLKLAFMSKSKISRRAVGLPLTPKGWKYRLFFVTNSTQENHIQREE